MSMTALRGGVEFRANAVPTISVQLTRETMRMITDEVVPLFDGHAETGGCLFGPRSNVLDRAHINVTVAGGPTEETEHGARSAVTRRTGMARDVRRALSAWPRRGRRMASAPQVCALGAAPQ